MDGTNRLILASDNLGWPNGVTIDIRTQRVVWVDAKTEVLLSVSLFLSLHVSLLCVLYVQDVQKNCTKFKHHNFATVRDKESCSFQQNVQEEIVYTTNASI